MNGYSKLRLINKSRSIDFSDLITTNNTSPDEIQKTHENITPTSPKKPNNTYETCNQEDFDHELPCSKQQQSQQDENEDEPAKYFRRNSSVSSAISSQRFRYKFKFERQKSTTKRGILERVFSMRRSSSPSIPHEKYCRIHDQCDAVLLDGDEDGETIAVSNTTIETIRSVEKKKCGSRGRILKTCKRLLGF